MKVNIVYEVYMGDYTTQKIFFTHKYSEYEIDMKHNDVRTHHQYVSSKIPYDSRKTNKKLTYEIDIKNTDDACANQHR